MNIAIVISRFNEEITQGLLKGAKDALTQAGFLEPQITIVWVPGAVEIPLAAQRLAQTKKYAAILTLGAVIRGDTSHYDYVCQQVSYGCQKVMLEQNIPVIFGVLTTDNEAQAIARASEDDRNKGMEAAKAMLNFIDVLTTVK